MHHDDSIPPPIKTVLDLFAGDLADVKFPDVDRKSLAEAALEVTAQAEEAMCAEEALKAALEALADKQEQLKQKAERALAYAAVYAQGDAALAAKVEEATRAMFPARGRAGSKVRAAAVAPAADADPDAVPKRRGRPPKARPELGEAQGAAAARAVHAAHHNGAAAEPHA